MHQLDRSAPEASTATTRPAPPFLAGRPPQYRLKHGAIPVLHYAEVTRDELASDLEYLSSAGYRTIGLDEFAHLSERRRGRQRCVLLTFDDGRKNFWDVVMPMLREHDAHAALFVPSYWMAPHSSADDPFMSWDQLRTCASSGRVDVQSHAHRHTKVFTSNRLLDFASPHSAAQSQFHTWPMRVFGDREELGWPALGTPLYEAAPLLSATQRYLENGDLTAACCEFVTANGGSEFFEQPDWASRLREFHQQHHRPGYCMRTPDFLKFLAAEFEFSREQFRLHLGYAPRYFAYPWHVGSDISLRFAKHAGFKAIFGSDADAHSERSRRAPIPVFSRAQRDWLPCLPPAQRMTSLGRLQDLQDGIDSKARVALDKLQQAANQAACNALKARGSVARRIEPLASQVGQKIRIATSRGLSQLARLAARKERLNKPQPQAHQTEPYRNSLIIKIGIGRPRT